MGRKAKVIISDLHLGAGGFDQGNLLEDFCSDDAFVRFLAQLVAESQQQGLEMELIVAGDMFEFLQVPSLTPLEYDSTVPYPVELYASTSEADSSRKMGLIVAGHPRFFGALRRFLQASHPRRTLTIIKGNHDVNLHWPAVQDGVRMAIGATGARECCVSFEERRISREGIYVEHGHQYSERVNRFPDFEEPHDPDAPEQLYLPIGSRFVFTLFNDLERQLYWVDGIKPLTALIWYAFALDARLALRALWTLLRRAPSLVWESIVVEPRRKVFFPRLDVLMASLSAAGRRGKGRARGSTRLALARGWAEERAQRLALARVAAHRSLQEKAQVVVFGHTHDAVVEDLGDGAVYINSGTWTWTRDFSGEDYAAWKRLLKHPERYTTERRLNYVRIDYTEDGTPVGRLREFRRSQERPRAASVSGWA